MESEELFLHGLPTYSPACLRLTNVLMERIIRLLPSQADRYEACLIHRVWTTAAMGILWEAPQFANPHSVRHFLNTIRRNKQLALTVRKLDLVLNITVDCNDAFRESMRMTLERHAAYQDKALAVPQVIQAIVQQCERLDTLSIYGWQLEEIHLRLIAAYLPRLQTLRIIGSRSNKPILLPPLAASSLRKLHLYADFIVQPARFTELESLRLSLHQDASFDKLCNHQSTFPKVRELILANATRLKSEHLDAIFSVFPHLVNFALEDISHPIDPSRLVQSSTVKHLILRPAGDMSFWPPLENAAPPPAHLSTLLLDTCRMSDAYLAQLMFHLDTLTSINLHDCPLLTDDAMVRICESAPLEELEIVQCSRIGNRTVCALNNSPAICTLRRLRIESSGPLRPEDIYEFMSSAVSYSLAYIDINGYPNVRDALFGRRATGKRVVLDKNGIQSIAEQGIAPKERCLTSDQITRLAKALNMNVRQLEMLLDQVQLDQDDGVSVATETSALNNSSEHPITGRSSAISGHDNNRPAVTGNGYAQTHEQQQHVQQHSQKEQANEQNQEHQRYEQQQKHQQEQEQRHPQQQQQQQEKGRYEQQQQEQREQIEHQMYMLRQEQNKQTQVTQNMQAQFVEAQKQQQQPSHTESVQSYQRDSASDYESAETITVSLAQHGQPPNSYCSDESDDMRRFGGQEDLGGWGMTSDLSWLQNAEHSSGDNTSIESGRPSKDSYEHAWRQIARESPVVTAKSKLPRDQKTQDLADGWGTPKNIVEWTDDRLGYAHDVLEKQKRTVFWSQSDNGEWVELSDATLANKFPPPAAPRSLKSESTTGRPPSRGPVISRKKSFGPDTMRRSSTGPSRSASSRVPRTESANVDKWAAFSANEMQQFKDAKKRKSAAHEVEELEIPDLINLYSKDDDLVQPAQTTFSPPLQANRSTVEPTATKSTPNWI
ncbi:hypothetical protein BJV82DRAFT_80828 [Fennellomyces sp. T-0311]|nr:hypothetical protein BJV82DRAFT_80828 [Fennellomyces sp. T-0311]